MLALLVLLTLGGASQQCEFPSYFQGQFFSIENNGRDLETIINRMEINYDGFRGRCVDRRDVNGTNDGALQNLDSKFLVLDDTTNCYRCFMMTWRTPNIVQYKYTSCRITQGSVDLDGLCSTIPVLSDWFTWFLQNYVVVNCKNTFEGAYNFTYEWDRGGGGICAHPESTIVACQEPGSQYKDNHVFTMSFGKCPELTSTTDKKIEFRCLGSWTDEDGNVWSGIRDISNVAYREKFRCMLTRNDQEDSDNKQRYTMSWWSDCSVLTSPYDGPVRLRLQPIIGGHNYDVGKAECSFPKNFSGHWYHQGEYDVDIDINTTHIYFKSKIDQYQYKETYFICKMTIESRFLVTAVTVGKCEVDYVCLEMLPRHHSIIRWRMGKPYRLTSHERTLPDWHGYMLRQACSWYSFTIDRTDTDWTYRTMLLNPPVPTPCPINGRYRFAQHGQPSEFVQTRIRGVTERPRHSIDCHHYVSELKACDGNPSMLDVDAEYCETVDHTGRPIGEYDVPDYQLTCVGNWDENWRSFMVTWDVEDSTSAFRCWVYERMDWRLVNMSRSTSAACGAHQTARSSTPREGASLQLQLVENERLFDDCALRYVHGNPWKYVRQAMLWTTASPAPRTSASTLSLIACLTISGLVWLAFAVTDRPQIVALPL